jgi:hypothetical protein
MPSLAHSLKKTGRPKSLMRKFWSSFGLYSLLTKFRIRLATHLYADHLLDRDHYMEWLISGLEGSNEAKLPIWLLLVQIYWKDMLKLRRHGRRLVTAMINHHCSVSYLLLRHVLTLTPKFRSMTARIEIFYNHYLPNWRHLSNPLS